MKKFDRYLTLTMRFIMAAAMLGLLVFGTWQIFTRWVLKNPSTFTDEFLRYLLIWASFIGSAYCFYKDQHLALDLVTGRAKGGFKLFLTIFTEIAVLFFVIYVFIIGGSKLQMNATNLSAVMRIPFKILYLILPVSGCFIVVARVFKYMQLLAAKKESEGKA